MFLENGSIRCRGAVTLLQPHAATDAFQPQGNGKGARRRMAMPKKGARLFTLDGVVYRWRVRPNPTHSLGGGLALAGGP